MEDCGHVSPYEPYMSHSLKIPGIDYYLLNFYTACWQDSNSGAKHWTIVQTCFEVFQSNFLRQSLLKGDLQKKSLNNCSTQCFLFRGIRMQITLQVFEDATYGLLPLLIFWFISVSNGIGVVYC